MIRRFFLVALLALVAGTGCKSSTEPEPTVDGVWSGALGSATVTLTLSQNSNAISGTGNMAATGLAVALTAAGTFARPSVSITLTASGYQPMNFTGTLSGSTIAGTVNGSGYVNQPMTLNQQ